MSDKPSCPACHNEYRSLQNCARHAWTSQSCRQKLSEDFWRHFIPAKFFTCGYCRSVLVRKTKDDEEAERNLHYRRCPARTYGSALNTGQQFVVKATVSPRTACLRCCEEHIEETSCVWNAGDPTRHVPSRSSVAPPQLPLGTVQVNASPSMSSAELALPHISTSSNTTVAPMEIQLGVAVNEPDFPDCHGLDDNSPARILHSSTSSDGNGGDASDKTTRSCPFCGKMFSLRKSQQRHEASCSKNPTATTFACQVCGKSFTRETSLKQHRATVHEGDTCPVTFIFTGTPALLAWVRSGPKGRAHRTHVTIRLPDEVCFSSKTRCAGRNSPIHHDRFETVSGAISWLVLLVY